VPFTAQNCPACGARLHTSGTPTTLEEVVLALDTLAPADRAMMRALVLARYDVRGYLERAVAEREGREGKG
jgi:hypothetical protein